MKGYSLHVGVGYVDKDHYNRPYITDGPVKDARDYHKLIKDIHENSDSHYEKNVLLTSEYNINVTPDKNATAKNFLNELKDIIELTKDDEGESYVLITFSGHGATYSYKEKMNREIEFLCFYDRMLMEHEFKAKLLQFPKRVKCFIIIDACYSGGQANEPINSLNIGSIRDYTSSDIKKKENTLLEKTIIPVKNIHKKEIENIIDATKNKLIYLDNIETTPIIFSLKQYRSSVCFLSACSKNETTGNSDNGSEANCYFTNKVLNVWKEEKDKEFNYVIFHNLLFKKTQQKAIIAGVYDPYYFTHRPFDFNKEY